MCSSSPLSLDAKLHLSFEGTLVHYGRIHCVSYTGDHLISDAAVATKGAIMATDYDAPRKQDDELREDSLEQLKARRSEQQSGSVDEDEVEAAEGFELPGADLSNVDLTVDVVPAQDDEFTCSQCFLVHHRSQLAYEENGLPVCSECAS